MFKALEPKEIENLLATQYVGRLGCYADGTSYIVPVSYAYDGTYVYVRSFEGMKLDIMRKNPGVCFQADQTQDLANWKSVICWGEFEEMKDAEGRKLAIQMLVNRNIPIVSSETMHIAPHWPFMPDDLDDIPGVFFRVRLDKKTGRCEMNSLPGTF